ncbi:MAG TPA: ABC transporter ATP-binding protein, partial [Polyangium sp.]|nr:ABC transporter ATP-binding protein [Polyangium sp.]
MSAPRPASYPVGLGDQFRRNLGLYVAGAVFLAAQQILMARRDFLVRDAVNAAESSLADAAVQDAI